MPTRGPVRAICYGAGRARKLKPCPDHEREQADDLERDGLAAGIGTGNDQGANPGSQFNIIRHDRLLALVGRLGLPAKDQQRLARLMQLDPARVVENRGGRLQDLGKSGFGANRIEPAQNLEIVEKNLLMAGCLIAQFLENPPGLPLYR